MGEEMILTRKRQINDQEPVFLKSVQKRSFEMIKKVCFCATMGIAIFAFAMGCGKSKEDKINEEQCEQFRILYQTKLQEFRYDASIGRNDGIIKNRSDFDIAISVRNGCEYVFADGVVGKDIRTLPKDTVILYCKKHKDHRIK